MDNFIKNFLSILDEIPVYILTKDTKFREMPEWDSMVALSLVIMASEQYSKEISGDDISDLETLEDLYTFLVKK